MLIILIGQTDASNPKQVINDFLVSKGSDLSSLSFHFNKKYIFNTCISDEISKASLDGDDGGGSVETTSSQLNLKQFSRKLLYERNADVNH